ncbi:MAG: hypothetical protein ABSD11_13145 [Methylocella sp.]|jgi:hypothetical protein
MKDPRGTRYEKLALLRQCGSVNELVMYLCDNSRLDALHAIDRVYFEEDVREIIDIALERGAYSGRYAAHQELLLSPRGPEMPQ